MYSRLVDEQHPLAAIAQELTEQTWASITRAAHRVRPRRTRVWAKTSISRILSDPF
jgi:hypothetical protein